MTPREELLALRRLAELESKASGQAAPLRATRQPMSQDTSIGRTALDQGLQGATFGFSDEITDRIGAGLASLATDESYSDLLKEARGTSKDSMAAQFEQRPGLSLVSNLAGGLLTGGAGASTKTGTTLANSLRTGGTALRIGKGALAGAASGGLYGAGTADEGKRLAGAGKGAAIGGAFGAAVPAIGAAASGLKKGTASTARGFTARDSETLSDLASGMKNAAGSTREKMKQIGAVISSEKTQELTKNLDDALKDLDLIPELSPKTTAIVNRIKEAAETGSIELNKLDQYRRLLRMARDEDTVAASAVRKAIDTTVNNLKGAKDFTKGGKEAVNLLNQFRKEYTQAAKFDDISEIIIKANGDPNKIKSGLTRFINNADNTKGWTVSELAALRRAANATKSEQILKGLGRFGFEPNNVFLPLVGGSVAGFGAGAPIGIGLTASGTLARQLHKLLGRGKAEQVLRIIESGGGESAITALPRTTGITPAMLEGQLATLPRQ